MTPLNRNACNIVRRRLVSFIDSGANSFDLRYSTRKRNYRLGSISQLLTHTPSIATTLTAPSLIKQFLI